MLVFCHCDKTPEKNNLKGYKIILPHGFRDLSPASRWLHCVWQETHRAAQWPATKVRNKTRFRASHSGLLPPTTPHLHKLPPPPDNQVNHEFVVDGVKVFMI